MSNILNDILIYLVLIFLGIILRFKIKNTYLKKYLKLYILNLALPITIFISILSIEIDFKYLFYPLFAIFLNVILFIISPPIIKFSGVTDLRKKKTLILLLPSFAPGLSCFPIINEFLGYSALAQASIVDIGNKIFVLIILFFVAIKFHNQSQKMFFKQKTGSLNFILKSLIYEPINVVMILALIFLTTNNNLSDIPNMIISLFMKIKDSLAPAVFIFIGFSILFKLKDLIKIIPLLFIRSGLCLLIVTSSIHFTGLGFTDETILFIILSLSSVSFWPFAHMAFIDNLEKRVNLNKKTFDLKFGLNFLAYSLPFSTITILLLFVDYSILYNPLILYVMSFTFIIMGFSILYFNKN